MPDSTLLNPQVLTFSENKNSLSAIVSEALIVKNIYLGYKVYVVLDTFLMDKKTMGCFYKIYSYFQNLEASGRLEDKLWIQARNSTYRKSSKYFLSQLLEAKRYKKMLSGYEIINFTIENKKLKPMFFVKSDELHIERLYKSIGIYRLYWFKHNILRIERLGRRSYLNFLSDFIDFDENGNFVDIGQFRINGEWANQRVAELLPHNFKIERLSYPKRQ